MVQYYIEWIPISQPQPYIEFTPKIPSRSSDFFLMRDKEVHTMLKLRGKRKRKEGEKWCNLFQTNRNRSWNCFLMRDKEVHTMLKLRGKKEERRRKVVQYHIEFVPNKLEYYFLVKDKGVDTLYIIIEGDGG